MGLFSFNRSSRQSRLNWNKVASEDDLKAAVEASRDEPVLFFKHSTRCSISSMALRRFENEWDETSHCQLYFIDLIAHRPVSNALSEISGVAHQSPQAILIQDKNVSYHESHGAISVSAIQSKLD